MSAFGACYWTDEGEEVPWVQVDSLVFETFSSFPIAPTTTSHRWLDLSPSLESSDREKQDDIVVSTSECILYQIVLIDLDQNWR